MTRTRLALCVVALAIGSLPARADPPGADPVSASAAASAAGHYRLHCSGCHGAAGRGTPGATPGLHGLAVIAETEAGRRYLARVPGVAQAPLSDESLAALLDWVVAAFSEAPPAARFRAEEVGRLRARPLRDPLAARRALAGVGIRTDPGAP